MGDVLDGLGTCGLDDRPPLNKGNLVADGSLQTSSQVATARAVEGVATGVAGEGVGHRVPVCRVPRGGEALLLVTLAAGRIEPRHRARDLIQPSLTQN